MEEDFSACHTPMLNRFFRDYQAAHGLSGTNTKQRNLRHLFTWLEDEYDHPHPYTPRLNRYAPITGRPRRCPCSSSPICCTSPETQGADVRGRTGLRADPRAVLIMGDALTSTQAPGRRSGRSRTGMVRSWPLVR